jgi:hypothetical protein
MHSACFQARPSWRDDLEWMFMRKARVIRVHRTSLAYSDGKPVSWYSPWMAPKESLPLELAPWRMAGWERISAGLQRWLATFFRLPIASKVAKVLPLALEL